MEINSRKTKKNLKQQIARLNDFFSFLSNINRIEIKTRKFEWKSKQNISRLNYLQLVDLFSLIQNGGTVTQGKLAVSKNLCTANGMSGLY